MVRFQWQFQGNLKPLVSRPFTWHYKHDLNLLKFKNLWTLILAIVGDFPFLKASNPNFDTKVVLVGFLRASLGPVFQNFKLVILILSCFVVSFFFFNFFKNKFKNLWTQFKTRVQFHVHNTHSQRLYNLYSYEVSQQIKIYYL